jgi:hypothetical protein
VEEGTMHPTTAPSPRTRDRAAPPGPAWPYRRLFLVVEAVVAVGGIAGAVQLLTGTATPPVSDLEPLGLTSWTLPAFWLFATTAVPAATAAWCAYRRRPFTPTVVLIACATLAVELLVQIPFVGPSVLQAVFGAVVLVLGGAAWHARSRGWSPPTP